MSGADEKAVTLTSAQYETLLKCKLKLEALEDLGVDSWEGYEPAYRGYLEFVKRLRTTHGNSWYNWVEPL